MFGKKFILTEDGKTFLWSGKGDLHLHIGTLKEEDLLKGGKVFSNLNKVAYVFNASPYDQISKFRRGPAVINFKDISSIVMEAHLTKNSRVIEAGTGTGFLTATLSLLVKKVYSYEIRKDFFKIAKKNLLSLNIKNVELFNEDVSNARQRNVDAIVLDMPEPWKVIDSLYKKLNKGSFFISYLPNITQVQKLVLTLNELKDVKLVKIKESFEREWVVDEKRARPKHIAQVHTAFLVVARRL